MLKSYDKNTVLNPQETNQTTESSSMDFNKLFGQDSKAAKDQLNQYVTKGMQLVFNDKSSETIIDTLANSTNPIQGVADVSVSLVQRIDKAVRDSGDDVNDYIKIQGAYDILSQVVELGEASGAIKKLSPEEIQTAYSIATQDYLKGEISAGRVNKDELAKSISQGIQNATPDQRKMIDDQTKTIDSVAQQSLKQYGSSENNSPTQNTQGGLLNVSSI